ncbi:MAG TPA: glycosyl hydrolase family 8 [Fibrobacteria bacterium]|nr:glycosyl hydrolase family 8 [Fibrobacteria bacterium]
MRFSTIALVTALGSAASAANLFPNPSFEDGTTGWTLYLNSSSVVATSTAKAGAGHDGTAAIEVKVTTPAADAGSNWHIQLQTPQTWKAETGKTYKLSFWGKADASRSIHLGIGGGAASEYKYIKGFDFGLSTAWKQYEVEYTSTATGVDSVRFNLYVGAAAGTYTFDDFVLDTLSSNQSVAMVWPAKGAWYTGVYRNLFAEIGKTTTEIDAKVSGAFQQLFFGDASTEAIYRTVGTDEAYIEAIDSKDIRTEGMSYGMMIAVMMDRQDVFDKLWRFTKNKMQFKSGAGRGYFSWQVQVSDLTTRANGAAPDGEEYFVTALYLADKRWGSAAGVANVLNYKQQADSILHYMIPGPARSGQGPMIDTTRSQILFITDVNYTDPSYHLPGFYRMWAEYAGHHNHLWKRMADTSLAFLPRSWHPTTGLNPKFTDFDGVPMPRGTNNDTDANKYATDAHRTPMNYAFDWAWFKSDTSIVVHTKRFLDFLYGKGVETYTQTYLLDGTPRSSYGPSESQIGANAVAVLASDRARDFDFVKALWKQPISSGQWRYYNGLIQMMSLLHVSGKFKAYGSPGLASNGIRPKSPGTLPLHLSGRTIRWEGLQGTVRLLDAGGRQVAKTESVSTAPSTLVAPRSGVWILDAGKAGSRTVAIP